MLTFEQIFAALLLSVTAWTFVNVLEQPDMIFEKYFTLISKLPGHIAKPLGLCSYCLSGQLALWYFIFFEFETLYNFIHLIVFISLTIFFVKLLTLWIK